MLGDEIDNGKMSPSARDSRDRIKDPPAPSVELLRDALEAAIFAWEQAHCLLLQAVGDGKESKLAMLIAVHNKALELRLKAETQYREALERQGISRS
jgi:hypothetical protein